MHLTKQQIWLLVAIFGNHGTENQESDPKNSNAFKNYENLESSTFSFSFSKLGHLILEETFTSYFQASLYNHED